jgi:hypothetical protein
VWVQLLTRRQVTADFEGFEGDPNGCVFRRMEANLTDYWRCEKSYGPRLRPLLKVLRVTRMGANPRIPHPRRHSCHLRLRRLMASVLTWSTCRTGNRLLMTDADSSFSGEGRQRR